MNAIRSRFTASRALGQVSHLDDDEHECSDYAWGSQAGFGSLVKGVPEFAMPQVADVRYLHNL